MKEALEDILRAANDSTPGQRIATISKSDPYEPFTQVNVNDVVNDVVNMSLASLRMRRWRFIRRPRKCRRSSGDFTGLRTAIMNIVINARQALRRPSNSDLAHGLQGRPSLHQCA